MTATATAGRATDVTDIGVEPAASTNMYWGHTVSDLQTGLAVSDEDAITGTLAYVSAGSLPTTWGAGNFMALNFVLPEGMNPEDVTVEMSPSEGSGPLPLDSDHDGVFKVTDKDNQVFKITYNGQSREFDLSGLTCNNA